jgi:hypothetical protein
MLPENTLPTEAQRKIVFALLDSITARQKACVDRQYRAIRNTVADRTASETDTEAGRTYDNSRFPSHFVP